MRFRQDDVEKRISDKTLLPVSVTYEDTHLDDDDKYQYFDVYFYDRSTPELKKHKDDDVFRYDGYVLAPGLAKAIKTVAPYAICNEPILIEGVDGTGKETLARAVHANCLLEGQFVLVDCGSYTAAEFESAMIGSRGKPGLVKRAEDGSLYLKDIEKLTLSMQELVLELLEPILEPDDDDEDEDDEVEMQIIASCSPDIKTQLAKKKFSRELYRALKEGYAVLPTLREHPASILPLFKQFVETAGKAPGKAGKKAKLSGRPEPYSYAKDVNATLIRLKWPGNYDDLIRCATLVSQVVAEQPGTITGAMIKECIDRPAEEKKTDSPKAIRMTISELKQAESPVPESPKFASAELASIKPDDQANSGTPVELASFDEGRVIRPRTLSGPVIGISMSKAWQDHHEHQYNELRMSKPWKETNDEIGEVAKVKCDVMLQGSGLKLSKILADEWTQRFEKVLVARRILIAMERHLPDFPIRLDRMGWVKKPKKNLVSESDRKKDQNSRLKDAENSYKTYCHKLGFLQTKGGDVLSKSFLWPEEKAWLDEYQPPE